VTLALGSGPGQLGAAFVDMDTWLGEAIRIVRDRYDAAIATASPSLALDAGIPLCAVVIAVLVFWGLSARRAEYRA
jgi:hypothetical protein